MTPNPLRFNAGKDAADGSGLMDAGSIPTFIENALDDVPRAKPASISQDHSNLIFDELVPHHGHTIDVVVIEDSVSVRPSTKSLIDLVASLPNVRLGRSAYRDCLQKHRASQNISCAIEVGNPDRKQTESLLELLPKATVISVRQRTGIEELDESEERLVHVIHPYAMETNLKEVCDQMVLVPEMIFLNETIDWFASISGLLAEARWVFIPTQDPDSDFVSGMQSVGYSLESIQGGRGHSEWSIFHRPLDA